MFSDLLTLVFHPPVSPEKNEIRQVFPGGIRRGGAVYLLFLILHEEHIVELYEESLAAFSPRFFLSSHYMRLNCHVA